MNKKFVFRNTFRGVTFVEMLISLLILGIVFGMGYTLMSRTFVSMERQRQSLDTLHEARNFLSLIERDLRQMTRLITLDTAFKDHLFHDDNALLYSMTIEIPNKDGSGFTTVNYSYEGATDHKDVPGGQKTIYRQEAGGVKVPIITGQLNYLKIWGTDGTVFRNRHPTESVEAYRNYLTPHYYFPSNPAPNGLQNLDKVRGVEVQLSMHELIDSAGKPVKQRTFVTRIYPRVLNSKFE